MKMRIEAKELVVDESRSNPMVVAMTYKNCPINEVCTYLVVGFGTVAQSCKYFGIVDDDNVECKQACQDTPPDTPYISA